MKTITPEQQEQIKEIVFYIAKPDKKAMINILMQYAGHKDYQILAQKEPEELKKDLFNLVQYILDNLEDTPEWLNEMKNENL